MRVKFIEHWLHKEFPEDYPPGGTTGTVVEASGSGYYVMWDGFSNPKGFGDYCGFDDAVSLDEKNARNVLRYGEILTDDEIAGRLNGKIIYTRINIVKHNNEIYYIKRINGKIVDYKTLG